MRFARLLVPLLVAASVLTACGGSTKVASKLSQPLSSQSAVESVQSATPEANTSARLIMVTTDAIYQIKASGTPKKLYAPADDSAFSNLKPPLSLGYAYMNERGQILAQLTDDESNTYPIVIDLAGKSVRTLPTPGEPVGWLPDGKALLRSRSGGSGFTDSKDIGGNSYFTYNLNVPSSPTRPFQIPDAGANIWSLSPGGSHFAETVGNDLRLVDTNGKRLSSRLSYPQAVPGYTFEGWCNDDLALTLDIGGSDYLPHELFGVDGSSRTIAASEHFFVPECTVTSDHKLVLLYLVGDSNDQQHFVSYSVYQLDTLQPIVESTQVASFGEEDPIAIFSL